MPPLVPGGEAHNTDCRQELHVVNPNNVPFFDRAGRVSARQACRDGDPTCDGDGTVNGACIFQLAICFNCTDPTLPTCGPDTVVSYGLFRPRPLSSDPVDAANAQALLAAVGALGGTLGGPNQNLLTFDTPLAASGCTALVSFAVPVRGTLPGRKRLQGHARAGRGSVDADLLRLSCLPAA